MTVKHKGLQYRLYPNVKQKEKFAKTFGCCRKVYNLMLDERITVYKETGESVHPTPAKYKEEYPFLKEVDSLALANEQMNLETAYKNFFGQKKVGFPKFKSKRKDKDSYTTNLVNGNIKVSKEFVKLPKIGYVKIKIHRPVPEGYQLKSATITREKDDSYFISLKYEYEEEVSFGDVKSHIGFDYASDGLCVDSNGKKEDMPKF